MTAPKKGPASVRTPGSYNSTSSARAWTPTAHFSADKMRKLFAELEVPFHPSVVEWQVTNITEDGKRGRIMPYADPRAYMDRLNELFTPAGWTRKYTMHTSPPFERNEDQKVVAKVFVTCDLTIHSIGSHSATGEEWTDDDNAGTSAEAQAFKRACSCFGLGRYLYSFGNMWVDLDDRHRPLETPQLMGWATPEGWRQGQRPSQRDESSQSKSAASNKSKTRSTAQQNGNVSSEQRELIQQIEAMAEPLGKSMYRGLLKTIARVWEPSEIRDAAVLNKVLTSMQSATHGLQRLETVQEKIRPEALKSVLASFKLRSLQQIDNLETLRKVVTALEEKADQVASA